MDFAKGQLEKDHWTVVSHSAQQAKAVGGVLDNIRAERLTIDKARKEIDFIYEYLMTGKKPQ